MSVLERIARPKDLKSLSLEELNTLAGEIRELIIKVVSINGGHLASNLGTVELTLALHQVFDAPRDRIVWDVGHQTYTHKIITGRKDKFHTLRQFQGLSGFPKRSESDYDTFDTGHGGTSISAALGMAEARDHRSEQHKVVAVIGDGSMTSGMAFEGLNNAGPLKKDFVVILNDNEMSISPNVGALSSYLSRLLTGKLSIRLRRNTKKLLQRLPREGGRIQSLIKRVEESLKVFFTPGVLFEELGFKYIGPIKGHDLSDLIDVFQHVRLLDCPALVHVITRKGKGYPFAEDDPTTFHGISPFDISTGKCSNQVGPPTYTEVFGDTMTRLAQEDDRIVGITAAMSDGTGLDKFGERFPGRFYDVGMAEQHAVTFAAGLAIEGFKPVTAIYSTFLQRAYDQVLHDVCLMNLPVTFVLDRGGLVGEDGPTHHGTYDLSFLRSCPNMVIMAPKDESELPSMLKTALEHTGPVTLRFQRGRGQGVEIKPEIDILPIGAAEVMREGKDIAILAVGSTVYPSLEAARELEKEGILATVVNMRFVKPLDEDLLRKLASSIQKFVTVEDNVLTGGFGSGVLEFFQDEGITRVQVTRAGLPEKVEEHGPLPLLRASYGIDAQGIAAAARETVKAGRGVDEAHL